MSSDGGCRDRRADAEMRLNYEKIDDGSDARLDALGTLRRTRSNIVENRTEVGKCRKRVANLHSPCFAQTARTSSSRSGFRCGPLAAFDLSIAARSSRESATGVANSLAGELKNNARDIVLLVRRKNAHSFQCLVQEFGHK